MNPLPSIVLSLINNIENKEDIENTSITKLVENLIRSELKPGGPYKTGNKIDPVLNAHILKLFILLKKPLPNVEEYINNYVQLSPKPLDYELETILSEVASLKELSSKPTRSKIHRYKFYYSFLDSLTTEVRRYSEKIGNTIIRIDRDGEILDITRFFNDSMSLPTGLKKDQLKLLGQANFMIWVAYSIYDSIIDDELNQSALSAANIFLREAIRLYLLSGIDLNLVIKYTNKVDSANAWETTHCRFNANQSTVNIGLIPSINNMEKLLSDRAIAHIIGPIYIASKIGLDARKFKILEKALIYYCIARQLNDDLHDWVDDFSEGRITFVVASLLHSLEIEDNTINKKILLGKMRVIFYEKELENLSVLTESYITKSINLLTESGIMSHNNLFTNSILKPIQLSADKARQAHKSNKSTVLELDI